MPIKLNGATSGSVELDVPAAVGSDLQLTLPATAGDVVVKAADGSVDLGNVDIDSSGRLLVGTSSARSFIGGALNPQFQIEGTDDNSSIFSITRNSNNTGTPRLIFGKSRGTANGAVTAVSSGDVLGSFLFDGADGTDTATAASIDCAVDGTPGANDMPGRLVFSTTADGASSPTEAFRIKSNQELDFSVTAASWNIRSRRPAGANQGHIEFFNGGTGVGYIATTPTNTSYNTSSDYRLKENVVNISDGITRVKQLLPRRFNFIIDADKTVDGFIAHEAQVVVPEAVTGTKDATKEEEYEVTPAVLNDDGEQITPAVMGTRTVPDHQGIDQSKLVPLLTAALQEAIAKIETLETKVAALEAAS